MLLKANPSQDSKTGGLLVGKLANPDPVFLCRWDVRWLARHYLRAGVSTLFKARRIPSGVGTPVARS